MIPSSNITCGDQIRNIYKSKWKVYNKVLVIIIKMDLKYLISEMIWAETNQTRSYP